METDKDDETYFECCMYIEHKDKKGLCQCGQEWEWHEDRKPKIPIGINRTSWKPENHTKIKCPHGEIIFCGYGKQTDVSKKFIHIKRTEKKSNIENLYQLLQHQWNRQPPKLLISITGGAKRFKPKSKDLLSAFKKGVIKAATSTGAWIITGGSNDGVMRHIGEAVRDHNITVGTYDQMVVAIGIARWKTIHNYELLKKCETDRYPAIYKFEEVKHPRDFLLDNNHTHFIFIEHENTTPGEANVEEISVRTLLVKSIAEQTIKDTDVKVPAVLLVLEGGVNSLKNTMKAVTQNIHAVVFEGSGRAADFIAKYCKNQTKADKSNIDVESEIEKDAREVKLRDQIIEDAQVFLPEIKDNEDKIRDQMIVSDMEQLIQRKELVTIVKLNDADTTNSIDKAILKALLNSSTQSLKDPRKALESKLRLAMIWNRCDVARDYVLDDEHNKDQTGKMEACNKAIRVALCDDKPEFVTMFMDYGVNLKECFTDMELGKLYQETIYKENADSAARLLKHLIKLNEKKWYACRTCRDQYHGTDNCGNDKVPVRNDKVPVPKLLECIPKLLDYLTVYHYKHVIKRDDADAPQKTSQARRPTLATELEALVQPDEAYDSESWEQKLVYPREELYLWAVLLNRMNLAKLFWAWGRDQVGATLVASGLLKKLSWIAEMQEERDLSNSLMENAVEFEELGTDLLSDCYERDNTKTSILLTRKLERWGNNDLLGLADAAKLKKFMGHSCCQAQLTSIWMGNLAPYTSRKMITLCIFTPLALMWLKFTGPMNLPGSGQKVKTVTFYKSSDSEINVFTAIRCFYGAPIIKCIFHTLSFLLFLALFSFFLLTDLHPISHTHSPSSCEYFTWIWAGTMLIEEGRQCLSKDHLSLAYKFREYINDSWNKLDVAIYMMMIVSVVLRFTLQEDNFIWARTFYSLTLPMYFMRSLQSFYIVQHIGPKIIMIREMMSDLILFLCILAIFLLAYGVSAHALRHPNTHADWNILFHVLYQPYWNIYGVFMEHVEDESDICTNTSTHARASTRDQCSRQSGLANVLFAVYMILTNVLLINLLIAMFNYTFQKVQGDSAKVWKYYRCKLVTEYKDRPLLAPPLIIFSHIYLLGNLIYRSFKFERKCQPSDDWLSEKEQAMLSNFELEGLNNYKLKKKQENVISSKAATFTKPFTGQSLNQDTET